MIDSILISSVLGWRPKNGRFVVVAENFAKNQVTALSVLKFNSNDHLRHLTNTYCKAYSVPTL